MVFALLFIFQTNYLTKFYPSFCHLVIQKCQVSNKSYFSESAVMQKSQDCQMIWSRLISPPPTPAGPDNVENASAMLGGGVGTAGGID